MRIVTEALETSRVIPALLALRSIEKKGNPSIVDVRSVSPELASKMEELGYTELTKDLITAFRGHGIIQEPDPKELCLFSGEMSRRFLSYV